MLPEAEVAVASSTPLTYKCPKAPSYTPDRWYHVPVASAVPPITKASEPVDTPNLAWLLLNNSRVIPQFRLSLSRSIIIEFSPEPVAVNFTHVSTVVAPSVRRDAEAAVLSHPAPGIDKPFATMPATEVNVPAPPLIPFPFDVLSGPASCWGR